MADRGEYRAIHVALIDDPDFLQLAPPARLALMTLKLILGVSGIDVVRALGLCDVVALATGDADFTPLVRLAQERGARVEVLAFRDFAGQELKDACDRFVDLGEVERIFLPPR